MFKSSLLYRRWWYIKKRNIKRIRMLLRLSMAACLTYLAVVLMNLDIMKLLGF
ncbi:MAG: hypothetical protein ACOX4M_04490 [Acetivibrionales bacterium]